MNHVPADPVRSPRAKPAPPRADPSSSEIHPAPPSIAPKLLAWFKRHARQLPWRQTSDPFAIWVSEVMLQQTQVAAVIPFYHRFLQAFPDIQSLAAADESQVLRLWEGLGYYRRARSLHQAARKIVAQHQGHIADDALMLAGLPGLGRYTVNAILSQAFDRRVPIVEANSRRVLCRLLGIDQDPRRPDVDALLWNAAEQMLPRRRGAGSFNQALMEVGALICTPRQPMCDQCPLADDCLARQQNRQDAIPFRPAPPAIEKVDHLALVIRRGTKVLIGQRPAAGRWGGLWEFPHHERTPGETQTESAQRLLAGIDLHADLGPPLLTIRHGVTRFRITLVCMEAHHRRGRFRSTMFQQSAWVAPARLGEYPFSSPQRRLADVVS